MSGGRPGTIHDHPVAAMRTWHYPAPGAPDLAGEAETLLREAGLSVRSDAVRGRDHGAWLAAYNLFPEADLPVFQIALHASFDPERHLLLGRILAPLRERNVLIVGSGGATHNLSEFARGWDEGGAIDDAPSWSRRFDAWVEQILVLPEPRRSLSAVTFESHPDAGTSHPSTEHFLPLLVALGAAGSDPATRYGRQFQHGLSMAAYVMREPGEDS